MKQYIIGDKESRKVFIIKPVLELYKCDVERGLMSNIDNVYQILFKFYEESLVWYKRAINEIQDYNQEL
jgi:hypothetical protein